MSNRNFTGPAFVCLALSLIPFGVAARITAVQSCEANLTANFAGDPGTELLPTLRDFESYLADRAREAEQFAAINGSVKAKSQVSEIQHFLKKAWEIDADLSEPSSSHRVVFGRSARGRSQIRAAMKAVDQRMAQLQGEYKQADSQLHGRGRVAWLRPYHAKSIAVASALGINALVPSLIVDGLLYPALFSFFIATTTNLALGATLYTTHQMRAQQAYFNVRKVLGKYLDRTADQSQYMFSTDHLRLPAEFASHLEQKSLFPPEARQLAYAHNSTAFNSWFGPLPNNDVGTLLLYHVDQIAFIGSDGEPNWLTLVRAPNAERPKTTYKVSR